MKKIMTIDKIILLVEEKNIKTCILDFDYTLTNTESNSSIGVFNNMINSEYRRKKKFLDIITKYFKTKTIYNVIWKNKLKLLNKYNYKKYLKNIEISKSLIPNDEILALIKMLIKLNTDIIIYSSGLKIIIEMFLSEYGIKKQDVKIIANIPEDIGNIVTPFKNKLYIESKCICIGDKKRDLKLVKNCINILVDKNTFYMR